MLEVLLAALCPKGMEATMRLGARLAFEEAAFEDLIWWVRVGGYDLHLDEQYELMSIHI